MRFFRWLKNVMEGQLLRRRVNVFSRRLSSLEKNRLRSARNLGKRKKEILRLAEELSEVEGRVHDAIQEAVRVQKQYEEQLEAAKSQLRIMEDVTVPTLMQQNRMLLKMWEAETSIQVMKTVAADTSSRSDME